MQPQLLVPQRTQRAQRKTNDEGKAALLRRAGADRRTYPLNSTNRRLGRPLLCGLRPRKGNSERQKRKAKRGDKRVKAKWPSCGGQAQTAALQKKCKGW